MPATATAETATDPEALKIAEFFTHLHRMGNSDPRVISGDRYACIMPFMFTTAILVGRLGDAVTYDNRWCYKSYADAKAALDAWDPDTDNEPDGWHRHPMTSRRREYEDGVLAIEYVNP